ncbi:AraC family transcriptional regulator [Xanthobacter sp. ZOL 2024]
MDPLSEVISLLRPSAALSKPITGRGDWGARYAAYGQPGFAIVLAGRCWLAIEKEEPVLLDRGDFVLLPDTPSFTLSSRPGVPCVPCAPSREAVHHGDLDGEPDFRMLGGSFRIDPVNAPVLLELLPAMIHIHSSDAGTGRLGRLIDLMREECGADRPGRDMIIERLLEVLLMECLRWRGRDHGVVPAGLLAGLRDPALAGVLRGMHADVRTGWTVAELAAVAGMSRSAFSARFSDVVGCAPIEYLSRWRMALAQNALSRGGQSLERLAEELGYESASAFSTAFRRRVGTSPGAFARARRSA